MVLLEGGLVTQRLAAARNNMLCCGGTKEGSNGGGGVELAASPRRSGGVGSKGGSQGSQRDPPQMVVQSDFRKVSGISSEIFRQIETVENDHDASTAAAMDVVERRGEMVVRLLDPRTLSRSGYESAKRFLALQTSKYSVQLVEIVKRPGQTLGLYIREGNGTDRQEGVFISRIALESPVYNSGCLRVGDEVLAVNLVDVTRMSLDDVVIIMSIPRRLLLTTRSRRGVRQPQHQPNRHEPKPPPVVVLKKDYEEEPLDDSTSNGDQLRLGAMGRPPPPHGMPPPQERFSTLPRYRPPDMSALRHEEPLMYYNRGGPQGPPPLPPHYGMKPGPPPGPPMGMGPPHPGHPGYGRGGRMPGPGGSRGYGMSPGPDHLYQPPPPVITEQPRPRHPPHFYQYDRAYPKTLESLAERIHSFYGPPRPPGPPSMEHDLGYGGTLGRTTAGRPRLARTLSDQRLPATEREALSDYEGSSGVSAARRYKAWQQASLAPLHQAYGSGEGATLDRYQEAMRRLSALRQRTRSVDYASDTEVLAPRPLAARPRSASSRSNSLPRQRHHRLGSAPGGPDPLALRSSMGRGGIRSSLGPGMRLSSASGRHSLAGSEDESDGAVSAPEMPSGPRHDRGRLPSSVFTSDEYRSWLTRAPSTTAIYDRIRQGPGGQSGATTPIRGKPGIRFTYSADNLTDRSRDDLPYYARRLQLGTSGVRAAGVSARQDPSLLSKSALNTASLERGAGRRLRGSLLEDVRTGGAGGAPHPSPTKGLPALSLLDINPAEFLKYKVGVGSIGGVAEGVSGILWVHLLAGRGLKAAGRPEFRDLYCVLECDRVHKARTVVRTGDHNFDWDETFDLDLINNKELDFLIYSWDPQFRHKLCYKGSVHLVSLLKEAPLHQLALKVEPRGTLYLKLSYTPPVTAFLRTPKLRKNAVFGVDLETVSQRESGGSAVPLVIARCVAEVERRGLDIIGLYRLCGSATKKRLLRDAFERNPRLVDLSADNVPDINVITGILKDYLRELPEPLFTKCLYQMLVDALTVMLPDDPEGNAKLMFSILDCLPKMNKITLFLLMDHLRLVSSQAERNKMTTQNLAICFGPVLMLQSEPEAIMDFHQPISILKFLLDLWPSKSVREVEAASARNVGLPPPLPRHPPPPPLHPTTKVSGTPPLPPPPLTTNIITNNNNKAISSPQSSSPSVGSSTGAPNRRKHPSARGQLNKVGSGSGGGSGSSTPHSPPGSESDSSPNPPVSLRAKLPSHSSPYTSGNNNGGGSSAFTAPLTTAPYSSTSSVAQAASYSSSMASHTSTGLIGGVPLPGMVPSSSAAASESSNNSGSMTSTPTSSITSPPATSSIGGIKPSPLQGGSMMDPPFGSGANPMLGSLSGGPTNMSAGLSGLSGLQSTLDSYGDNIGGGSIMPNTSSGNNSSSSPFASLGQHQITNISTNPFLNGQHLLGNEDSQRQQ